jgi:signal transduction histidine kinase
MVSMSPLGHSVQMTSPPAPEQVTDNRLPWFRSHPRLALAVAVLLAAAVFVLRLTAGGADDVVNLLYTLPIALVALAFGRTAGITAGLLAVGLVVTWVWVRDVDLSALGWASRVVPMLLLGGLLGDASDRLAAASTRQRELEAAAQRHRDAIEINDSLVQGMAAAKWSLEAGRVESGMRTLEETLAHGQRLVSKLLREADMGVDGHRPPAASGPAAAHGPTESSDTAPSHGPAKSSG